MDINDSMNGKKGGVTAANQVAGNRNIFINCMSYAYLYDDAEQLFYKLNRFTRNIFVSKHCSLEMLVRLRLDVGLHIH